MRGGGRIAVHAFPRPFQRSVERVGHVLYRECKAVGQDDICTEIHHEVLARGDRVRLHRPAETLFPVRLIASSRLIDDGDGNEHGQIFRRVFGKNAFRDALMQQIAEIIGHVIARRIADGAVPCVRTARPSAALRRTDKRVLAERVQKIGIAVQFGIGSLCRERLTERPARIGIAVPPDRIAALARGAPGAVCGYAREQTVFDKAQRIVGDFVAGTEAEALEMVVELMDTAPEGIARVVHRCIRIERGRKTVQRAVDGVPADERDHASGGNKGIV